MVLPAVLLATTWLLEPSEMVLEGPRYTSVSSMQELFKKLALDLDSEGKAIPIVETAFSRVSLGLTLSLACRLACLSH